MKCRVIFLYMFTRTFSLLDGLSKPDQIAKRIRKLGLPGTAITEHGNIASSVQMIKALKGACMYCGEQKSDHPNAGCDIWTESPLKPILGCEMYLSNMPSTLKSKENRKLFHQVVLAKNQTGWQELIQMTSDANDESRYYHKPRLDLQYFEENNPRGIITFSGHLGSRLANVVQQFGKEAAIKEAERLRDIFGRDNFFIEIQRIVGDADSIMVSDILREVGKITGIGCVATADSHFCAMEDSEDQKILLCNILKTTLGKARQAVIDDPDDVGLGCFFKSNKFHIPSLQEMQAIHTGDELENTMLIASMVEDYNILGKPILPPFECPNGMSEAEYLRQLCRDGWDKKIKNKIPKSEHDRYADRIKMELGVLQGANLSGYFLILEDIVKYVRSNGWLVGPGRGSAAGCFTSYLIGITSVNPIEFGLLFERFYNEGRNTKDHVSYPDIDMDIPKGKRAAVIQYVKDKYGHDRVGQMATYGTMQGRSALTDVLKAHGNISFDEIKKITKFIPDKAKIDDDLQEMKEEFGESSVIRWALENNPEDFKEWCYIDDKNNLQGPLAKRFEQAMRLEGTKTTQSKHASGLVIAPRPLSQICPMILDKKKAGEAPAMIAGMEMGDLESLGLIKLDILGLTLLDKMAAVRKILATGDIYD